jgi:hypothetical protein
MRSPDRRKVKMILIIITEFIDFKLKDGIVRLETWASGVQAAIILSPPILSLFLTIPHHKKGAKRRIDQSKTKLFLSQEEGRPY